MMWKIAGNRDVAIVDRLASGGLQAREQMHIAISLSIIFIPGKQRAAPQRDSKHVEGALRNACCHLATEHCRPG
jgi:hypothetical protein